ncbi:L,D-transpeptidase catalytic domain [Meinhardsimonia xiamenensis]|jgi:murein L,D-transpeptidase YafK|uniref:L,D-transpeptidase catalytic domain n=1 Tax=Meinhardsimonia xiamenensis TaxID=990712 RepID=A0A1G8XZQ8_9RHOB|nr:L,D-transpeptidase family protein [Meinhardsimonia xiamenensis]PRX37099.1 L,D-transpeptidase-like protein [Meinhardsimonia xiamenensis]SDJ95684.1 L,D-transpeptidase catalytic domain [Meinhardsimonia xiamenensis]
MGILRVVAAAALVLALTGCASKFKSYDGPEVTRIVVHKSARVMYLMHHDQVLTRHRIDLGFAPEGAKRAEGDGRTPEGRYYIDRRNPRSRYYLSLGISYPNARDIQVARAAGASPGGDIFIHGKASPFPWAREDWTWGCIAVTNREMRDIYAMVKLGTPIDIYP